MSTSGIPSSVSREIKTYVHGKKESAVKVYTVNQESRFLVVEEVPALGVEKDLVKLVALHGTIEEYRNLDDYETPDAFTEVFWFKFESLTAAR